VLISGDGHSVSLICATSAAGTPRLVVIFTAAKTASKAIAKTATFDIGRMSRRIERSLDRHGVHRSRDQPCGRVAEPRHSVLRINDWQPRPRPVRGLEHFQEKWTPVFRPKMR
jgi:hypothetical protein